MDFRHADNPVPFSSMINKKMAEYKEVFAPGNPHDPGAVFYTITTDDIGKINIETTAGTISVGEFMGQVTEDDVGKQVFNMYYTNGNYRGHFWHAETSAQRDTRLGIPHEGV